MIETFGRLDVLVNNAGVNIRENSLSATETVFDETFAVNVKGLYRACVEGAKLMLKHNEAITSARGGVGIRGRIINVSAVPGRTVPPPGMTVYGASKAAVDSLTQSLAAEWGESGILVNAVAPGITETDIIKHDQQEVIEKLASSFSA